jgi:hypothetical protein
VYSAQVNSGRLAGALYGLLMLSVLGLLPGTQAVAAAQAEVPVEQASVTVRLEPAQAELWIDGKRSTQAPNGGRLTLAPGSHRFEARRAGYGPIWRVVKLQPGERSEAIGLRLVKRQGRLTVVTNSREAEIFVDGQSLGFGRLDGPMATGLHRVRVVDAKGERALSIVVLPGAHAIVRQEESGNLLNETSVAGDRNSSHNYQPPWLQAPPYGLYVMGYVGLQAALNGETAGAMADDRVQGGPLGGLRAGYRFARHFGAEGLLQYGTQAGSGIRLDGIRETYDLTSLRFGVGMRFWLPERSVVGLLAGVAAGGMWNRFSIQPVDVAMGKQGGDGLGGFAQLDVGLAFSFRKMFASLSMMATVQTTSGLGHAEQASAFGDKALVTIGPTLGLGYGFW